MNAHIFYELLVYTVCSFLPLMAKCTTGLNCNQLGVAPTCTVEWHPIEQAICWGSYRSNTDIPKLLWLSPYRLSFKSWDTANSSLEKYLLHLYELKVQPEKCCARSSKKLCSEIIQNEGMVFSRVTQGLQVGTCSYKILLKLLQLDLTGNKLWNEAYHFLLDIFLWFNTHWGLFIKQKCCNFT